MIAMPAGFLFLLMAQFLLRNDKIATISFFTFATITLIFSVTIYPLSIRHLSLCALLLVILVWRGRQPEQPPHVIFISWLGLACLCGLLIAALNLVRPFDTADDAARFIERHKLTNRHWVSYPESRGQGVAALLGIQTERPERNCMQSYVRWNFRSLIDSASALDTELQRIAARIGGYYLLTDAAMPITHMRPGGYRLLTHIKPGYIGQHFYIYRVMPGLPERKIRLPQCSPTLPPVPLMPSIRRQLPPRI
jgi:hypothetical protein